MQIRFLLGPAGSGKTRRCLAEIRSVLADSPEGPPLVLLAPKQATFQLEHQLLAEPGGNGLAGYTRLHILSFERLASFVFEQLRAPAPRLLDEEGRLMVLRAVIAKHREELNVFRASARLTGFAQQLSRALHELQKNQLTPESLLKLARQTQSVAGLPQKLDDLAALLRHYLDWLEMHHLQDANCLIDAAARLLRGDVSGPPAARVWRHRPEALWLDGFASFSPAELGLLAGLASHCERATLAFCLDREPVGRVSWLSTWSQMQKTYEDCRNRLADLPLASITVETLSRHPDHSRFQGNPILASLEERWADIEDSALANPDLPPQAAFSPNRIKPHLRLIGCPDPETEAATAAREILRFVRAGGRFREVSVMVRNLEGYHDILRRSFARYSIPCFLDRREAVAHHPLAELTRSALRLGLFQWAHDDWFAALKSGLVEADETLIDQLENEALARGWKGAVWQQAILIPDDPALSARLESLRQKIVPPFQRLILRLTERGNQPTGPQLAGVLRDFWRTLEIESQLEQWAAAENSDPEFPVPPAVHATVWEQMNAWLDNVEHAFPEEPLPLREWLPILEAGLANLSVGVIPPALDQVLVGAVDRSRNPNIRLAFVLGLNETVFPAPPRSAALFTEADCDELEKQNILLGASPRSQLGRERYLAYIACTRPRQQLVLTWAAADASGKALNPSPFLGRIQRLFPGLELEFSPRILDWRESEHPNELVAPLLRVRAQKPARLSASCVENWEQLSQSPALKPTLDRLEQFHTEPAGAGISSELAERLYSPVLHTSVSRLEQFAACPFRFFVHSGLRAEERRLFELDPREQGSFQHDALALFHEQLQAEGKQWRDLTPQDARARMRRIAQMLQLSYRDGLLQSSDKSRFTAGVLADALEDFVEVLVGWMREQYRFDPVQVELPFGEDASSPAWELALDDRRRLALYGRIDRIDLWRDPEKGAALGVVVDYKSSQKKLDPTLVANGLQLQLLAYLNVLRHWPNPETLFGAGKIAPVGGFYVNLRGKYEAAENRFAALADAAQARKLAYRHAGRFNAQALRLLDNRVEARQGDQFNYRLSRDGTLQKNSREALTSDAFAALLDSVETHLKKMGEAILNGEAAVSPYRHGSHDACEQCDYQAICRVDPWTHPFRPLKKPDAEEGE